MNHIQALETIQEQNQQIQQLQEELDFMRSIFTYPESLILHMHAKTKQGMNVWVNSQTATLTELQGLDKDNEVDEWIRSKQVVYKDRDW